MAHPIAAQIFIRHFLKPLFHLHLSSKWLVKYGLVHICEQIEIEIKFKLNITKNGSFSITSPSSICLPKVLKHIINRRFLSRPCKPICTENATQFLRVIKHHKKEKKRREGKKTCCSFTYNTHVERATRRGVTAAIVYTPIRLRSLSLFVIPSCFVYKGAMPAHLSIMFNVPNVSVTLFSSSYILL